MGETRAPVPVVFEKVLAQPGQPAQAQALAHCEQLIALNPAHAALYMQRGDVLQQLDQPQAALDSYSQAAALDAMCFEAHFKKAVLLHTMGQPAQALAQYTRVLEIKPDLAEAFSNRGNEFLAMGRLEEALCDYGRAVALQPALAMAYNNRANTLQELRRYEEAIADYDHALRLDPGLAAAYSNRGNSLKKLNRLGEAQQSYANALALKPDNAKANFNDALARLLLGDFARGWRQYEWRWKDNLKHRQRHYPQPLWLGGGDFSELPGKTVLLYFEQGFGDTLQFCRYAALLARHGARVLLEVQPALFGLLRDLDGVSRLLQHGAAGTPPEFDLHCPLLSLPLAFGTDEAGIPQKMPYVFADPGKAARWQARLGAHPGPRVGLVSAGSATHRNDASRSLPFAQLLGAVPPGWSRVCLHKELRGADAEAWTDHRDLLFFGPELHDFAETAALIACLDLVVTVDTSVAHLAAAMGKPTWIMLAFAPDWRWQLERADSPWYPSARLFRQPALGDWTGVLAQVAAAMRAFVPEAARHAPSPGEQEIFLASTVNDMNQALISSKTPETPLRAASRAYAGKRWTDCERLVQQALAAQPESVQAWRLAGALAFQGSRPAEAQAAFEKVLALAKASGGEGGEGGEGGADDWFNLGSALDQPRRLDLSERAEQAYRKALALGPTNKETVLRQLAAMLRAQYRFDEARMLWQPELDVALATGDRAAQARIYTSLASVALGQSRWPAAKPLIEAACEADPAYAESQFNRALGLLTEGDFEAGWPAHEWRWKVSQAQGSWRDYGTPWTGDDLGERILLVWAEQGFGDAMQFARFLPQLRAAHPRAGLLLVCRRALHPVLADMAAREYITLMPGEDAVPGRVQGHDVHVPLLSLPLHLGCRLEQLPPPAPLAASRERVDVWHERMTRFCYAPMPRTAKGAVRGRAVQQLGLVWSGSDAQAMAQRRNMGLADLEPLLSVRGVQWHSLQLGPAAAEIATSAWQGCIVDWSHHLTDFGETAALMSCLDGVVSVDTACVHLAASLGRPTWMLSRFDACWRWMAPREDSPWYPGLKIFNQGMPGEWEPVVRALGGHLSAAA